MPRTPKRPDSATPPTRSADERRRGDILVSTLSKINHDLRNALATATLASPRIAGGDEMLAQRILPRLVDAMKHVVELSGEAVKVASCDTEQPVPSRFALHTLVDEVGNELRADFPAARWTNEIDQSNEIEADRIRVALALAELGRNALENGAGEVRITFERVADRLFIEIADDGPGLAPRARAHLFTPFLSATRPRTTGAGLALSRLALRSQGGDLRLETSDAAGTTFVIELPAPNPD